MSGKVLATIAQALTVEVIDAMAGRTEMDRASARKAAALGVPAILTALTELVARSSGLARLRRALARQSTGSGPVEDGRGDGITFLLGGEEAGALASAIGRSVGAPERTANAFLDELTSTILHTLAREAANSDAVGKGVANLLNSEKDLIAAAMPAGLSNLLCANTSSRHLGAGESAIGGRGTARRAIHRPSPRVATAWSGRRRSQAGRAVVSFIALVALAGYVVAAKVEQTGDGGSAVVTSTLPEPNARPQAQAAVTEFSASAQHQGPEDHDRAGEKIGAVTDVLGGPDGIALALVSLGRFLGFGGEGIALPVAHDGRLVLETRKADLHGRQHLHFVSPEFRDAIRPPVPSAADKAAGPTIAAHEEDGRPAKGPACVEVMTK